jgi:hypothetical protein
MPCPSHPPWLGHSNYIWWRECVTKLLIMQFHPTVIVLIYHRHELFDLSYFESSAFSSYFRSFR